MTVRRRVLSRHELSDPQIAELLFGLAPGFGSTFSDPDEREASRRTLDRIREDWDDLDHWRWSLDSRLPSSGGTRL